MPSAASFSQVLALLSPKVIIPIIVTYWVAWIIYARFFHPLHNVPGPFLASISRSWIAIQIMRGDCEYTQRALHKKFGPVVRLAPNEVACSDPSAIKTIYGIKAGYLKTDFYPLWACGLSKYPDHFSNVDEKLHASRRKIVNNVYSMSSVLESEEYLDHCSELFMQRMGENADQGAVFDFGEWLQMYAFDVIGELYFGRMFGFMQDRHDYGSYIESLDQLLPPMVVSAVSATYVRPLIFPAALLFSKTRKAIASLKNINQAARTCVAKRRSEMASGDAVIRNDILNKLFAIHNEKGEKYDFQIPDIEQEAYVAIFAGSDTTAIAMRSVFYHLMRSPAHYNALLTEIDNATSTGDLSAPNVKYAEAIKLPYLVAVIKEAMRLHPSVGLTMPRIVPRGGVQIGDTFVPEGYRVGMNGAVVHYDRTVFGEDAGIFNPERWFREDAANMDRHMIQFGAGARTCIGKNISLSEIHKLVPQFLRAFTIELAHPEEEWRTSNVWFNKQTGLEVRVQRRR